MLTFSLAFSRVLEFTFINNKKFNFCSNCHLCILSAKLFSVRVTLAAPLRYYSGKLKNVLSTDSSVNVCIRFPSLPYEMGTVNYPHKTSKYDYFLEAPSDVAETDTLGIKKRFGQTCDFCR